MSTKTLVMVIFAGVIVSLLLVSVFSSPQDDSKTENNIDNGEGSDAEKAEGQEPGKLDGQAEKPHDEIKAVEEPEDETKDAEKAEDEMKDAEKAGDEMKDAEKAEDEMKDAEKPEDEMKDAEKPEDEMKDAEKPEDGAKDAEVPEADTAEAEKSEVEAKGAEKPESEPEDEGDKGKGEEVKGEEVKGDDDTSIESEEESEEEPDEVPTQRPLDLHKFGHELFKAYGISFEKYAFYGNFCGFVSNGVGGRDGANRPIDACDRCCQKHDDCFDKVRSVDIRCDPFITSYNFTLSRKDCLNERGSCGWEICRCDIRLINCIKRKSHIRKLC